MLLAKDYAFDFRKLNSAIDGFIIEDRSCRRPHVIGAQTFMGKAQSAVRVCLDVSYEQQYFCFSRIADGLIEHFQNLDSDYTSAQCNRQEIIDIVQAYTPILQRDITENLIAGLKRLSN